MPHLAKEIKRLIITCFTGVMTWLGLMKNTISLTTMVNNLKRDRWDLARTLFFTNTINSDIMILWACIQDPHKKRIDCTQTRWGSNLKPIDNKKSSSPSLYISQLHSKSSIWNYTCGLFSNKLKYLSINSLSCMRPSQHETGPYNSPFLQLFTLRS